MVGTLEAWDQVVVNPSVAGTVERVLVDLGDRVFAGQVLVELDKREYRLSLEQAQANWQAARENLAKALASVEASKANWERLRANRQVMEANRDRAKAVYDEARATMERLEALYNRELISAWDLDQAKVKRDVAAAQLQSAQTELAYQPQVERAAEAQYQSDQAAGKAAEGTVAQWEAAVGLARKKLGDATIRAPLAAAVSKKHVSAGEFVKDTVPTVSLVVSDPLKYTGAVPERFAPQVRPGQAVTLEVEAYPGRTFRGTISRISPAVDVQTRSLTIEVTVPNREGILKPGFFAKGQVLTRHEEAVSFVPEDAVYYFVGITKVFVVADGKASERVVKTGSRQNGLVEIMEGIRPGEQVATSGLARLFDGAPVEIKHSPGS